MMEMTVIRSDRKSFSMEIGLKGLILRVPKRATKREIQAFLDKHQSWIDKHAAKAAAGANAEKLTQEQMEDLADQALKVIPERVRHYAPLVGVTYGRITIRCQKTRWGSCSAKGNLNFNCLLMLAPKEVLDSVVVHELCHRKHMNHSANFYQEVLRVFPEYREWTQWLKENGTALLARVV